MFEYMAEEVNNAEIYECLKSDIWSMAVVMFCLASGKRPYCSIVANSEEEDELLQNIYNRDWKNFENCRENYSKITDD